MLSLYVPGTSPVHRAPAGLKLAVLAVLGVALFATARLELVAAALVLVLAAGLRRGAAAVAGAHRAGAARVDLAGRRCSASTCW